METQTLITLGATPYATTKAVLVHEIVHQWYGDQVTPSDWSDLWMNEGMAMYLQFVWQAEATGVPLDQILQQIARTERESRRVNGPPAAYDPKTFGEIQVYYGPALMWDQIRQRVGEEKFWAMVRAWPAVIPTAAATATTTSPGSRRRPAPSCPTCSTAGCSPSARRSTPDRTSVVDPPSR